MNIGKVSIVLLTFALAGCIQSVDDCILRHMDKAHTQTAAHMIKKSCENKY